MFFKLILFFFKKKKLQFITFPFLSFFPFILKKNKKKMNDSSSVINPFSEEAIGSQGLKISSPTLRQVQVPVPVPVQEARTEIDVLLERVEDPTLRKLFKDDIDGINECAEALKSLQTLQMEMASQEAINIGCFDEEDWKIVSEKKKQIEVELQTRQTRVLRSMQEYDEKVIRIMKTLDTRAAIIDRVENNTRLFTNPLMQDMSEYFVQKHQKLEKIADFVQAQMKHILSTKVRAGEETAAAFATPPLSSSSSSGAPPKTASLVQAFQNLFKKEEIKEKEEKLAHANPPKKPNLVRRKYSSDDDSDFSN